MNEMSVAIIVEVLGVWGERFQRGSPGHALRARQGAGPRTE